MNEQRGFECRVQEGTYNGTVTVWVDAEAIEYRGNGAIENAATEAWRRKFGPSLGMAYYRVEIVREVGV